MQKIKLQFPLRFLIIAAFVALALSMVITTSAESISATIIEDGQSRTVKVSSTETQDILEEAGITIQSEDVVTRSDSEGIVIEIERAVPVMLDTGSHVYKVYGSKGDTVQDILDEQGVTLNANDTVTPPLGDRITKNMEIEVTRNLAVTLIVDGEEKDLIVPVGTVADVVYEAGVILGRDDEISPDRYLKAEDGMTIEVNRVKYREVTVTEEIPYETVEQKDDTMYVDARVVVTEGKNGSRTVTKREKVVDGVVEATEEISSTVITEAVDEVVRVGTKRRPTGYATMDPDGTLVDHNGNIVNYSSYISGKCTAYTSNGGYTSTGRKAQVGLIAVDPDVIPYGTKVYVCSPDGKTVYGYAIAADTGGAMLSGRILADLYYDTVSECYNFGVREMRLYIVEE